MNEGAVAFHELYLSYVEAGFTEKQALELVKVHLQEILRNARTEE